MFVYNGDDASGGLVGTAHPLYQESRYAPTSVNCFCFLHLYIDCVWDYFVCCSFDDLLSDFESRCCSPQQPSYVYF
jgi:hypothetical protein